MPRRLILFASFAAAVLVVAACHRGHHRLTLGFAHPLVVGETLNCPIQQGRLTRISASADGHACAYHGDDGEDVQLTLTALNGQTPGQMLAPTEVSLRGLLPGAIGPTSWSAPSRPAGVDHDEGDSHTKVDVPFVHVDADEHDGHDHAKVDVPFVHVDADDDKANVKVFGVSIHADNQNANINANWGSKSAVIKAGPHGAEIRASNLRHGSTDLVYILASDQAAPGGYHTVGYLARGPDAGPLVVATFKSRADHDQHFHDHDLDQLMSLNVHS